MKTAAKFTIAALGCIGLASLALWGFADHRRGVAWAVAVVRARFPDVSHLSPSSLGEGQLAQRVHPYSRLFSRLLKPQ